MGPDGCLNKFDAFTGAATSLNVFCDGGKWVENKFATADCAGEPAEVYVPPQAGVVSLFSGKCTDALGQSAQIGAAIAGIGKLLPDCSASPQALLAAEHDRSNSAHHIDILQPELVQAASVGNIFTRTAASLTRKHVLSESLRGLDEVKVYFQPGCVGPSITVEFLDAQQAMPDGCLNKFDAFTGAATSLNVFCDGGKWVENKFATADCAGEPVEVYVPPQAGVVSLFSGKCTDALGQSAQIGAAIAGIGKLLPDCSA